MTRPEPEKNSHLHRLKTVFESRYQSGILLSCAILLLTAVLFWPLAYATVIAISLAVVLMPVQRRFSNRIGPGYAAISVCLLVLAAAAAFFCILLNTILVYRVYIFTIASTIADAIRTYQPSGKTMMGGIFHSLSSLANQTGSPNLIENTAPVILNSLSGIAQSIPGIAVQFFIVILILFLLLRNGEDMAVEFVGILPARLTHYLTILWSVVADTMYGVYVVNISVAVITFFITIPFFWVLGYGQILFWAFLCAASHLFPFFGPQIITLLLAIYAIASGDLRGLVLIGIIGYPLISGLQDFLIRPRLLAKRVAIHPVLMMIGLFGGMLIMGAIGLIIGPLIVALAHASYNILTDIRDEIQGGQTNQSE